MRCQLQGNRAGIPADGPARATGIMYCAWTKLTEHQRTGKALVTATPLPR